MIQAKWYNKVTVGIIVKCWHMIDGTLESHEYPLICQRIHEMKSVRWLLRNSARAARCNW